MIRSHWIWYIIQQFSPTFQLLLIHHYIWTFTKVCHHLFASYYACLLIFFNKGTNDQWDFLRVLVYLLETRKLTAGDILALDNAKVHGGAATISIIVDICTAAGVHIHFMPSYSPELSPAKQVHNYSKAYIRANQGNKRLWEMIILSHARITTRNMVNWYRMCVE